MYKWKQPSGSDYILVQLLEGTQYVRVISVDNWEYNSGYMVGLTYNLGKPVAKAIQLGYLVPLFDPNGILKEML